MKGQQMRFLILFLAFLSTIAPANQYGACYFSGPSAGWADPVFSGTITTPLTANRAVVTNGSSALSTAVYTNANTASAIVQRDASGNFSAGTITANLTGNASGTAASFTGNLTGDVTSSGMATTLAAATVTGKLITGFSSGAGTVAASDTILQAINKLDGNVATKTTAFSSAQVICDSPNGHGAVNTKIRRWTTCTTTGTDITYATDANAADTFTINTAGLYQISYTGDTAASDTVVGISVNSNQLTTSVATITTAHRLGLMAPKADYSGAVSVVYRASATDVIRAHTNGVPDATSAYVQFRIIRIL